MELRVLPEGILEVTGSEGQHDTEQLLDILTPSPEINLRLVDISVTSGVCTIHFKVQES